MSIEVTSMLTATGETEFFLAKPNLSLLRLQDFISCEMHVSHFAEKKRSWNQAFMYL